MVREFKKIVCPTDFSDASYHALEYALQFVKESKGTLIVPHILHNAMSPEFQPAGHTLPFEAIRELAAAKLQEVWQEKLESYPDCKFPVEIGDPFSEILTIEKESHADLVVVSTHGRTGLTRVLIGSVVEKLVRHATCPVFVVRQGVK
jgi:nucleotide-binding universal stress UspA family protein